MTIIIAIIFAIVILTVLIVPAIEDEIEYREWLDESKKEEEVMGEIKSIESAFRQSYDGLAIGDKVYFNYRDERKNNPDRYRIGTVIAGGMTEERHTTYLFGLFVIPRTRKVTKVLVEMKDGENTERFLRRPSECFKVVDGGSSDA